MAAKKRGDSLRLSLDDLLDERSELMSAFGQGPYLDGLLRDRIDRLDLLIKTQFSRHQVADLSPPPAPHPTRGRG